LLGAAEALEALVELLDATGRVHDALLARVEGVRSRGDLDVDHRVLDAVQLDGLVAGDGRTGEEGLSRAEVAEHDGVVLGVNVSLHGIPYLVPWIVPETREVCGAECTKGRFYQMARLT